MIIHQVTGHLINWLNHESSPSPLPLCDFERFRHELKPCDVILVEGRSRVSGVIRLITASPWTHAALYIGRIHDIEDEALREALERYCDFPPNEQLIIESVLGKGTIVNSLSFYTNDHIRICRPAGLSYKDAQQVVRYAISRLGAEYDVRQIFDLARFLFPWFLLPRRWRSSLFRRSAGDSTRTVCSTMIAEAFGFIQFPILPLVKKIGQGGVQLFRRNPKICVPSDFDYSPHFEIIKYPFIDLGLHKDYRLLPWKGSGQLSREEAKLYFEHQETDTTTATDIAEEPENVTSITKLEDQPKGEQQTVEEATPAPQQKDTVSPFKRVANRIEDALPRSWLENSTPEPTAETLPAEDESAESSTPNSAEEADHQAQNESTFGVTDSNADSDSPPEDQPTSQTLTEKGNSDTDVSAETADDDKSNGKTDSTPSMENNPIENNSETLKENTPENGNEASAVEKWLRSITSSRPKSDD